VPVSNGLAVPVVGMHQIEGFGLICSLQNKKTEWLGI